MIKINYKDEYIDTLYCTYNSIDELKRVYFRFDRIKSIEFTGHCLLDLYSTLDYLEPDGKDTAIYSYPYLIKTILTDLIND